MELGWGKLYVMIVRRPCFFCRKNNQSAIFTTRRKNSHCIFVTMHNYRFYVSFTNCIIIT